MSPDSNPNPSVPATAAKWAWSKIVVVWGAIAVVMTAIGWYFSVFNLIYPESKFALTEFEASATPVLPPRGQRVTQMLVRIDYTVAKARSVTLRGCVARVSTRGGNDSFDRQSSTFDITGTNERSERFFEFRSPIGFENAPATFNVTCAGGVETGSKRFNFPQERT
jgi:hypothetical protein